MSTTDHVTPAPSRPSEGGRSGPVLTAESMVKACSKCGEVKRLEEFHRKASASDGRRSHCKGCQVGINAAWREAHPERQREANAAWYQANVEKVRETNAARRAEDPARAREYGAAYYAANADRARETDAAWRAEHPEAVASMRARRTERVADATCPCLEGWGRKRLRQTMKQAEPSCYLCGGPSVGADHVVPLVDGGRHCWGNLRGCCFRCNSRKGRRSAADYVARMEAEGTPVAAGWDSPGPLHCTA